MPLKKSIGRSKKAYNKAVSANISELTNANKSKSTSNKRSREQIVAIAINAAKGGKKK